MRFLFEFARFSQCNGTISCPVAAVVAVVGGGVFNFVCYNSYCNKCLLDYDPNDLNGYSWHTILPIFECVPNK